VIEGELKRGLEKGIRRKAGKGNRMGLELGGIGLTGKRG